MGEVSATAGWPVVLLPGLPQDLPDAGRRLAPAGPRCCAPCAPGSARCHDPTRSAGSPCGSPWRPRRCRGRPSGSTASIRPSSMSLLVAAIVGPHSTRFAAGSSMPIGHHAGVMEPAIWSNGSRSLAGRHRPAWRSQRPKRRVTADFEVAALDRRRPPPPAARRPDRAVLAVQTFHLGASARLARSRCVSASWLISRRYRTRGRSTFEDAALARCELTRRLRHLRQPENLEVLGRRSALARLARRCTANPAGLPSTWPGKT